MRAALLTLLPLVACAPAPTTPAELDARLADQVASHTRKFGFDAGVAVAVVEEGAEVARLVTGDASPSSGAPVTGDTPFLLASTTKLVTALVVLQLVDEGALSLDDRITDRVAGLPPAWDAITIELLLSHADGLPDPFEHPDMAALDRDAARALTPEQYVAWAAELEPAFPPGEDQAYGQTGFVLLSMAVASAAGKPFADVARERVLDPVGMAHTTFALDAEVFERDGDGAAPVPIAYWGPDVATAAMVSPLDDVVALAAAIQRGEVVSDAAWDRLTTPADARDEWALGLQTWRDAGLDVAGHSGGWSVVVAFVPSADVATISLSNVSDRGILDLGYDVARTGAEWAGR